MGQAHLTELDEDGLYHPGDKTVITNKNKVFLVFFVIFIFLSLPILYDSTFAASFKNEPTGFREIRFGASSKEFLRKYPNARRLKGKTPKNIIVFMIEHERFWDWDDIAIRFVFFKDRLYSVAIDYTPLATGPDFDSAAAKKAADLLMLRRAEEYYGTPEVQEKNGLTFYVWRGYRGGVVLGQYNNSLVLSDSQLMIELQNEVKKHGP